MSLSFQLALLGAVATLLTGCATQRASVAPASASAARDKAPEPARVRRPAFMSGEYRRSWALSAVNADPAYRAGATGRGITVALIDSGLEGAQPEVVVNASADSTDLIDGRTIRTTQAGRHGGYVAGSLASALNNAGTLGVAYEAKVLSIRVDMDGACERRCAFRVQDIVRGIDYALDRDVKVILLAVQGTKRLSQPFEDALQRAADAGAVVVIAAGNGASSDPSWPARYAADPRFKDTVIAVGAVDMRKELAQWSNRAGESKSNFLVAPGQQIYTDCDTRYCSMVSGTSFAAPYVAGAVALLIGRYPELSSKEAAALVLASARDLGEPGEDTIYGRGHLDVGEAFRAARARLEPPRS